MVPDAWREVVEGRAAPLPVNVPLWCDAVPEGLVVPALDPGLCTDWLIPAATAAVPASPATTTPVAASAERRTKAVRWWGWCEPGLFIMCRACLAVVQAHPNAV